MTRLVWLRWAAIFSPQHWVFRDSRWAPHAAIFVGFASAVGFAGAHLLPTWGAFSDSFINASPVEAVTWFSWETAILKILGDLVLGAAGVAVLVARFERA